MIRILEGFERPGSDPLFDAMYEDRKRVFVNMRKWEVPVIDGKYEVDQFDGRRSVYCISTNETGAHLGSIRLLPTDETHILGDLFPDLCDGPVPRGPEIWEMTRGCLSPSIPAILRREVRNKLTTAVVQYALHRGITSYTCIADNAWLRAIPMLGWDCRSLGAARMIDRSVTGALQVHINGDTPARLQAAGSYVPARMIFLDAMEVAHA